MKKNLLIISLVAGCFMVSSCVSKKDLENCQLENKELTNKYQETQGKLSDVNSELAASKVRVTSLRSNLLRLRVLTSRCRAHLTRASPQATRQL